jgi:hypothetical protein
MFVLCSYSQKVTQWKYLKKGKLCFSMIGFENDLTRRNVVDSFIGEYVIIHPATSPNTTFGGKLTEIVDGYGILNPHQGIEYNDRGETRIIIEEDSIVFLAHASIEPTTKKNLENYCKMCNEKNSETPKKNLIVSR